ncbi:hypothetical protein [Histidinibacterium aquaticum]|uniref:Lipoprotein n=1 Tax=Histidinibacterium aquaticum TaxID=2613962 RepID=A0A5J5GQC1_9RHOB|nr:hypothetical protein [Histidinibacterium aquaticum]KAA9010559.1 hypothetical protein F3S47_04785 [Histidinibacterium aquaticum]
MDRRVFLLGASALGLSACGAAEPVSTPQSVLDSRAYVHPGPPMLSLFTMKNVSNGNGMHTGLMINASQRVIFDPAGTFGGDVAEQPWGYLVPENNDVHFGITPEIEDFYARYHARQSYYVLRQDLPVDAQQAEVALRNALSYGAVPKAQCTTATSRILKAVPGFGDINVTLWPDRLSDQLARRPRVSSREYRENDSDDKTAAAEDFRLSDASR